MFNYAEFLKPTPARLAVFLLLFVVGGYFSFFIFFSGTFGGRPTYGFPLGMLTPDCNFPSGTKIYCPPPTEFHFLGFIGNLVFWYLVSALLVFAYEKMVKK
ncbi:hypothetical protein KJ765_05550 [Candidatus Micrarchaeota archaeon]|nr:hypothetical protein [Candidatus Micrarchaeota archaeon]